MMNGLYTTVGCVIFAAMTFKYVFNFRESLLIAYCQPLASSRFRSVLNLSDLKVFWHPLHVLLYPIAHMLEHLTHVCDLQTVAERCDFDHL